MQFSKQITNVNILAPSRDNPSFLLRGRPESQLSNSLKPVVRPSVKVSYVHIMCHEILLRTRAHKMLPRARAQFVGVWELWATLYIHRLITNLVLINLCYLLVVAEWTSIVLILDHILQAPHKFGVQESGKVSDLKPNNAQPSSNMFTHHSIKNKYTASV